jgi:predicted O-methyltransferase YrrM
VAPSSRLRRIIALDTVLARQASIAADLSDQHGSYVTKVSSADMAASLELSALFHALCEARNCRKILDLGSGFSSLVSGLYARRDPEIVCWSVDDSASWLSKTRDYLSTQNVFTNRLVMLDEFIRMGEGSFDIVLLDLGLVDIRVDFIPLALDRCRPGGMILFDDVHKPGYRYEVLRQCNARSVRMYDIASHTLDLYGRYALLGVKG